MGITRYGRPCEVARFRAGETVTNPIALALGLILAASIGAPSLAEQRGGPHSGNTRPQTPAEKQMGPCVNHRTLCNW